MGNKEGELLNHLKGWKENNPEVEIFTDLEFTEADSNVVPLIEVKRERKLNRKVFPID